MIVRRWHQLWKGRMNASRCAYTRPSISKLESQNCEHRPTSISLTNFQVEPRRARLNEAGAPLLSISIFVHRREKNSFLPPKHDTIIKD